jgi:hypothetical protein
MSADARAKILAAQKARWARALVLLRPRMHRKHLGRC